MPASTSRKSDAASFPAVTPAQRAALLEEVWKGIHDKVAASAWPVALRWVLDDAEASARCGRRACKLSGRCCLVVDADYPLSCGGAELSDEMLAGAAGHVLFACMVLRCVLELPGLRE